MDTFIIPNKLCERAGLSFAWKPINDFGIFAYEKKHFAAPDKPTQHYPTEATVFNVKQINILATSSLRKLVNESNSTFLNLQTLPQKKTPNYHQEILNYSRQYRSIIRASLESIQEDLAKSKSDELQGYIGIFYSVECVWHLCEILFMEPSASNVVLPHLLEWIRFHFPKHDRNAAEMFCRDNVGLETSIEYWPTVIGSLLQGQVKLARGLLKQHTDAQSKVFVLVDQILKAMPVYDNFSGTSVEEFRLQWSHWIMDIQSKIDANMFSSEKNLDFIMKMIVKDDNTWTEVQNHCETWYELLAGWLFFSDPAVKPYELGEHAKTCIKRMSVGNKLNHLDKILLAVLDYDLLEVLKEVQKMGDNGWFVTHLSNLLYHSGKLAEIEKQVDKFPAKGLQDFFTHEYGSRLIGHKSLWQVGLSYLDYTKNGLHTIELLLPRIKLDSEYKTNKIIREAQKRGLSSVVQTVCKIQGKESARKGRLGNALTWALKSQDSIFISLLADKYLREYVKNRKLQTTDILYNLGSSMLASDRLIFLSKYYEFYKIYQEKQFQEAGNLLIKLLESKIVPSYFWPILLMEAIPLLESKDIIFSSNDTYLIINYIEENEHDDSLKDKVDLLRLAAARNLSRAIIYETHG